MQGKVVKEIAGMFYVAMRGDVFVCKARGKIKHEYSKICVGDIVEIDEISGEYVIKSFLERRNFMLRPPVSNVDQIVVVISSQPQPDFSLIDKMLVGSILNRVSFVLCVNKSDILDKDFVLRVENNYLKAVDKMVIMSAKTAEGLKELKEILKDKTSCLAGQSAVGKSSITNLLVGENKLAVGDLSAKAVRGKHTTRHCELITLDFGGYIVDTPGFTFFDGLSDICPADLEGYYVDFSYFVYDCKYKGCTHIHEPICGVRQAVENGGISRQRYDRYVELYQDLKRKWGNRF